MPELVHVSVRRTRPQPPSLFQRVGRVLRSAWHGPFTLKDPALNRLLGMSGRTVAGPVVNEHTIFACSAFYDGVNQLASDLAKLPLNLLKRRPDGGSDHYVDSKTYKLMKHSPNPETRTMVFRRTMMVHALTSKSAFAEIERDRLGRPHALWILEPHRVQPFYDDSRPAANGRRNPLRYRIDGRSDLVIDAADMIHLQGLGWDGVTGFEMVEVAREAIGLALASQQFASAFFGNGSRFGGILTSQEDLDEPQRNDIREQVEKLHQRADKAFRLLVLGRGFKFFPGGTKPNEAQVKEIRDQQVQEVARYLNMPLHKLKNLDRATNNNIEQQDIEYYKGPILNWATLWEQELDAKLVPALETGRQYFKHNAMAFLRGDVKSRYAALGVARDRGVINADEWRELEDMNPQPGGQGKVYVIQSSFVPLDKIEAMAQAKIDLVAAPPSPPQSPAPRPSDDDAATDGRSAQTAALRDELTSAIRDRADRLERLVETLREETDASRRALETAAAGERVQLQAQIDARSRQCDELDLLAAELRAREATLREERDRLATEVSTRSAEALAAQVEAQRAREAADAAEARAQAAQTAADDAAHRAEQLQAEASAASERQRTAEAAVAALGTSADASRAEAEALRVRTTELADQAAAAAETAAAAHAALVTEWQDAVSEAAAVRATAELQQQALDALAGRQAELEATLERDRAVLAEQTATRDRLEAEARAAADAQATALAAEADRRAVAEAHARTSDEVRTAQATQIAQLESQIGGLRQIADARTLELAEARAAREAAERALTETRSAERARLEGVIAAHRELFLDALGRLTRREAEQARQKQATQAKLRQWHVGFKGLHEDRCIQVLTPVVKTHLRWMRRDDDAVAVTAALVRDHLAAFEAGLEEALTCDPQDFHAVLERMLARWERDRAATVADAFLLEAVQYVRDH